MAIINIKPEMKVINKFEFVKPVQTRNLVGRLGFAVMPTGSYTGDENALTPMTKLQMLQYGYKLVEEESMQEEPQE